MFAWLSSCCGADDDEKLRPSTAERRIVVLRDQPALVPAPSAEPQWSSERTYEKTLEMEREQELYEPRGRRYSRDNASIRNWFSKPSSSSSTRRLQISGPTNFRHLHSESFQYPPTSSPAPRSRPRSFRPLELSIYAPNNRLTPILPHLDCDDDDFITPPPRAYTANSSRWDASSGMTHGGPERSYSVMSFHIPRKHVRQSSEGSDAHLMMTPPRIPPKSRARASTAPNTERIVARIASAMLQKEKLQAEIDSVVERQSIYFNNRPSTAVDPRDLEPMPSIPAIPAAAPSFAERVSVDGRPATAPVHVKTQQTKAQELAQATFHSHPPLTPYSPSRYEDDEAADSLDRPLAPPLPLVLRPPLRKKKSFSRVSSWLQHNNNNNTAANEGNIDESTLATISPRPIKEADGFYQCVAPPEGLPRTSMETSSSVYTSDNITTTEDEEDETKTAPTTNWSPGSSPRVKQLQMTPPIAERVKYFDGRSVDENGVLRAPPRPPMGLGLGVNNGVGPRPLSVGVAF